MPHLKAVTRLLPHHLNSHKTIANETFANETITNAPFRRLARLITYTTMARKSAMPEAPPLQPDVVASTPQENAPKQLAFNKIGSYNQRMVRTKQERRAHEVDMSPSQRKSECRRSKREKKALARRTEAAAKDKALNTTVRERELARKNDDMWATYRTLVESCSPTREDFISMPLVPTSKPARMLSAALNKWSGIIDLLFNTSCRRKYGICQSRLFHC
jgi:hypothetical protein